MKNIQFIYFDVVGTLIEPTPSVGAIYCEVARESCGWLLAPETVQAGFRTAFLKNRNGDCFSPAETLDGRKWWRQVVWDTLEHVSHDCRSDIAFEATFSRFFEAVYRKFMEKGVWQIYPDVIPTLLELGKEVRLGVLSNYDSRLPALLKDLGVWEYFDVVLFSTAMGVEKPDACAFELATLAAGVTPARILHIGDSFLEDYQGAVSFGWNSLLLSRNDPDFPGEFRIGTLHEIANWVGI